MKSPFLFCCLFLIALQLSFVSPACAKKKQQHYIVEENKVELLKTYFNYTTNSKKEADSLFVLDGSHLDDIKAFLNNPERVKYIVLSGNFNSILLRNRTDSAYNLVIKLFTADTIFYSRLKRLKYLTFDDRQGESYRIITSIGKNCSKQLVYINSFSSEVLNQLCFNQRAYSNLEVLKIFNFNIEKYFENDSIFPKLKHLEIGNAFLNEYYNNHTGKNDVRYPSDFFNQFSTVEELILGRIIILPYQDIVQIPTSVFKLKNLKKLVVANPIKFPFDSLKQFPHLEYLDLIAYDSFPKVICSLPNLKKLIIKLNKPESIPTEISELKFLDSLVLLQMSRDFKEKVTVFSFDDFEKFSHIKKLKSLTVGYDFYKSTTSVPLKIGYRLYYNNTYDTTSSYFIEHDAIQFDSLQNLSVDFALGYNNVYPANIFFKNLRTLNVVDRGKVLNDYGYLTQYREQNLYIGAQQLATIKYKIDVSITSDNYLWLLEKLSDYWDHAKINSIAFYADYNILDMPEEANIKNLKNIPNVTVWFLRYINSSMQDLFVSRKAELEKKYPGIIFTF